MNRTITAAIGVLAFSSIALTGCSSSHAVGSRAELYDSVSALAADSSIILSGTVQEQEIADDIPGGGVFTLSTVVVDTTAKTDSNHPDGSTVVVRQHGSASDPGPGAMLAQGKTYLLYLHPSGLDGDLASHFYVTGGTAGVYETEQDTAARSTGGVTGDTEFTKAPSDEGDELPAELTLDDALEG